MAKQQKTDCFSEIPIGISEQQNSVRFKIYRKVLKSLPVLNSLVTLQDILEIILLTGSSQMYLDVQFIV